MTLAEPSQNAFGVTHRSVRLSDRRVHDLVLEIEVQADADTVELGFV